MPALSHSIAALHRPRALALATALAGGLLLAACSGDGPTALPRAEELVPDTEIELEYIGRALGAEKREDGSYPGFDTNIYPGDATMRRWRESGPYEWVGYYLPAPCHKDKSWSGKRETLERMGWGLAVVYVGQQTWDERPRPERQDQRRTPLDKCLANLLSAERGLIEANDAIDRTRAEGFPRGSVIFLDIERMEAIPQAMRDYYMAWTRRVVEHGGYRPGYYAHAHNAAQIHRDVRGILDAGGLRGYEPPFWISSAARAKAFSIEKAPEDVGHAFAHVWQGVIDVVEGRGGIELPIDVNVARTPNPSMPVD